MFYSDSESEPEQIIRIFFPVLPFVFVILSQRSLIILQGAGFDERFYPESDLAFECQYTSQSQIQSRTSFGSGSGQKFSKLRIPASTGVGAELKDQMNTVM